MAVHPACVLADAPGAERGGGGESYKCAGRVGRPVPWLARGPGPCSPAHTYGACFSGQGERGGGVALHGLPYLAMLNVRVTVLLTVRSPCRIRHVGGRPARLRPLSGARRDRLPCRVSAGSGGESSRRCQARGCGALYVRCVPTRAPPFSAAGVHARAPTIPCCIYSHS